MQANSSDFILQTTDLVKEFKGFTAVSDVNLNVQRGHIHALIGPNGAGKTTVFNLLTKFLQPAEIARLGIIRSFQISAVFPHLTVLENVRVALQRKENHSMHFWRSDKILNSLNDRAHELLESVGLGEFANTVTTDLAYGRKRALEIATTLALDPELMLLDEPTQGMGHEDVGRTADLIRKVSKNRTILMVEHNLQVVSKLADRITVLQRGAILTEGDYDTVSQDPQVREAYMGTEAPQEASA